MIKASTVELYQKFTLVRLPTNPGVFMSLSISTQSSSGYRNLPVDQLNQALDELSLELLKNLEQFITSQLPNDSLRISAPVIEKIHAKLSIKEKRRVLGTLASIAQINARCEVSGQAKGAAAVGKSGTIYLAHSIEFSACAPYSFVHPIQHLIAHMRSCGETAICELATTEELSGCDTDFLNQLDWEEDCKVQIAANQPIFIKTLITNKPIPQRLRLDNGLVNDKLKAETHDYLAGLAQGAGHHSYSPLTMLQAGVALQTRDGKVYTGSYLETTNCTTLGPLQGALVLLLSDKKSYDAIDTVILAERYNAKMSLEAQTSELLKSIAPELTLKVVKF